MRIFTLVDGRQRRSGMIVDDKHAGLLAYTVCVASRELQDAMERYKKIPNRPYVAETIVEYEARIKTLENLKKFFLQEALETSKNKKEV